MIKRFNPGGIFLPIIMQAAGEEGGPGGAAPATPEGEPASKELAAIQKIASQVDAFKSLLGEKSHAK